MLIVFNQYCRDVGVMTPLPASFARTIHWRSPIVIFCYANVKLSSVSFFSTEVVCDFQHQSMCTHGYGFCHCEQLLENTVLLHSKITAHCKRQKNPYARGQSRRQFVRAGNSFPKLCAQDFPVRSGWLRCNSSRFIAASRCLCCSSCRSGVEILYHATATYPEDRTHRIPFWLDILSGKKNKMSFIEAYMVIRTFEIPSVGRKNLDSHLLYTLYQRRFSLATARYVSSDLSSSSLSMPLATEIETAVLAA